MHAHTHAQSTHAHTRMRTHEIPTLLSGQSELCAGLGGACFDLHHMAIFFASFARRAKARPWQRRTEMARGAPARASRLLLIFICAPEPAHCACLVSLCDVRHAALCVAHVCGSQKNRGPGLQWRPGHVVRPRLVHRAGLRCHRLLGMLHHPVFSRTRVPYPHMPPTPATSSCTGGLAAFRCCPAAGMLGGPSRGHGTTQAAAEGLC